jgi:UDP-glucose 4-epimerase
MPVGPVIVTGAGGLVGGGLANGLMAQGLAVVGIVRSGSGHGEFESVAMDLETTSLIEACNGRKPLAIVHCAASVPFPPQTPDDAARADSTRLIDARVFGACAELGCKLIYTSSCILYDPIDPTMKGERSLVRATSPYAEAKLTGEREAAMLPGAIIMRLPSPVSDAPRQNTVIDRFIDRALSGEPLEVWGTGEREQDFIHVDDIADFVVHALRAAAAGTFNVASGKPVSMRQLANRIVRIVGRGSVEVSGQPDPQDGHTARYDTQLARDRIGWAPRVDLEAIIGRLVAERRQPTQ